MRRLVSIASFALALGALATSTEEARAADFTCPARPGRARQIFEEAVQLEAADPEGALVRYQCAAKLSDRPAIELRIGVVAERLDKLDIALAAFERYLELAGSSAPDAASMREHVRELKEKVKTPTIAEPIRPAKPEPPPPRPPPPKREANTQEIVGWSLVGAGTVAAIVGGIFLGVAKSQSDEVQSLPEGTRWASDDARGAYESAESAQTIGIVSLVIAPLAIGAGVFFLMTNEKPARSWAGSPRPLLLRF